jgi:hypothetical protein
VPIARTGVYIARKFRGVGRPLDVKPVKLVLLMVRNHKYYAPNVELLVVGVNLHPGEQLAYSTTQSLQMRGRGSAQ